MKKGRKLPLFISKKMFNRFKAFVTVTYINALLSGPTAHQRWTDFNSPCSKAGNILCVHFFMISDSWSSAGSSGNCVTRYYVWFESDISELQNRRQT